jgi:hypothetical protein
MMESISGKKNETGWLDSEESSDVTWQVARNLEYV